MAFHKLKIRTTTATRKNNTLHIKKTVIFMMYQIRRDISLIMILNVILDRSGGGAFHHWFFKYRCIRLRAFLALLSVFAILEIR